MATIKLGARPTSFARVVKTKDVDGTDLHVPVTFKYRTRKEYGAWLDTLPPQPIATEAMEDGKFSAEGYIEKMSEWNANKILQCVDAWGLDVDFTRESVKQLCDELPAVAEAVINDYQAACLEGRLGN